MTRGIKDTQANSMLNAYVGRTTFTANALLALKLHTGDPGSAGTSNASQETTRKAVTFGSAAASGSISSTVDTQWTNLNLPAPTTETLTDLSLWDSTTTGNFIGSVQLTTPKSVNNGDNFTIPSGSFTVNITPLAA